MEHVPQESSDAALERLEADTDAIVEGMNTPEFHRAVDELMNANPEKLQEMVRNGRAAAESAEGQH